MRYRKKPVVVEAVQFSAPGDPDSRKHAYVWACENGYRHGVRAGTDAKGHFLIIDTLEGAMRADEGDWIIKGVKGELYPCKPDIFDATYEPEPTE